MKKKLAFLCIITLFSCTEENKSSQVETSTSLLPDTSEYLTYSEMRDILNKTKEYIQKSSDFSIQSDTKFDKVSTIKGFNQIIGLLEGLDIQSRTPTNKMGAPIDIKTFEEGVEKMKNHIGLGLLYKNNNITGFEILKKDIDYLISGKDYYSIRAYPMVHPKETKKTLTYALITVREDNPMTSDDTYEDLNTLSDTWDPWPPRNARLSEEQKKKTLLRFY